MTDGSSQQFHHKILSHPNYTCHCHLPNGIPNPTDPTPNTSHFTPIFNFSRTIRELIEPVLELHSPYCIYCSTPYSIPYYFVFQFPSTKSNDICDHADAWDEKNNTAHIFENLGEISICVWVNSPNLKKRTPVLNDRSTVWNDLELCIRYMYVLQYSVSSEMIPTYCTSPLHFTVFSLQSLVTCYHKNKPIRTYACFQPLCVSTQVGPQWSEHNLGSDSSSQLRRAHSLTGDNSDGDLATDTSAPSKTLPHIY